MCANCSHRQSNCSWRPFYSMPVIKRDPDGTRVVKCTGYESIKGKRP